MLLAAGVCPHVLRACAAKWRGQSECLVLFPVPQSSGPRALCNVCRNDLWISHPFSAVQFVTDANDGAICLVVVITQPKCTY